MKKSIIIGGEIVPGKNLGRELGFPTINLNYDGDLRGVFAGRVHLGSEFYTAAINIGERPTLNDKKVLCEAFLLDFKGDLSGFVEIAVFEKVRNTLKFESLEKLKEQIAVDVENIRKIAKTW